jgi:serine protease Do
LEVLTDVGSNNKNQAAGNRTANSPANEHSEAKLRFVGVAFLIITSLSAGFAGGYFGSGGDFAGDSGVQKQQRQTAQDESDLISVIAESVGPSVVSVDVTSQTLRDSFFGPSTVTQRSAGTGFIIDESGVVVTNRHVVPKGISTVSVTLSDGTQLNKVKVIGRTADSDPLDVAFLKINDSKGKDLPAVEIGDSAEVSVGDRVVAIGNALGQFQNTVTSGIISGYGRSVQAQDETGSETLQNLFQTDAAINQGNSGGPLVDVQGKVIAINTALAGGSAQNIGFAIPINDVKGLINSVLKTGELQRPYLGVRYVSITDDYAYEYNLSADRGAYIVPSSGGVKSIIPGSPAAKAGLKEKDIITKVDETQINDKNSLTSVLGNKAVGDRVELTVVRGGETIIVEVTLEDMLDN